MFISSFFLIILYISHRYIVAWINFYNNTDKRFGNSIWRWTYDYKVVGERDISDLDDKPFVRKRRIRNRTVTFMYCNFLIGFFVLMSFVSNLLILILQ
jgi:RsiW-degrading membrane proteinase PrsW (M82 family)